MVLSCKGTPAMRAYLVKIMMHKKSKLKVRVLEQKKESKRDLQSVQQFSVVVVRVAIVPLYNKGIQKNKVKHSISVTRSSFYK